MAGSETGFSRSRNPDTRRSHSTPSVELPKRRVHGRHAQRPTLGESGGWLPPLIRTNMYHRPSACKLGVLCQSG